ncbi:MAG: hypothetical protein E4G96_09010 [Chrysiogenales bacterium]|nr:MAG: hypothetical protein E4G96_09010 [Chrysiogenales bacterium]
MREKKCDRDDTSVKPRVMETARVWFPNTTLNQREVGTMKKLKRMILLAIFFCAAAAISCATTGEKKLDAENRKFLQKPFIKGEDKETFRVMIMSDRYEVFQTEFNDTIEREKDPGGDKYICDEVRKYDKIDEAREGMYQVSLYPDRGTLMRVRPRKPMNLIELDNLILDDLQRWAFKFPKRTIHPVNFYVKYRIVLRKKQTDEQIIEELQKKMMGEE